MKRVLFVSILAALFVAACGEKSNLQVKARKLQRDGTNSKVEDTFANTTGADARKLTSNMKAARNILLGKNSVQTSVYCSHDLEKAITKNERIYLLGGSQVLILQDTNLDIPETPKQLGQEKAEVPQDIVNLICDGPKISTEKLEAYPNVAKVNLTLDAAPTEIQAKFSVANTSVQSALIACGSTEALRAADKIMMPESESAVAPSILITPETKMLLETKSQKGKEKEYILVTCAAEKTETAPEADKESDKSADKETPASEPTIEAVPAADQEPTETTADR
ncbi:hypothetical protein [Bdellovibrio sp. HCB337]|uniref:hypothetical protein n=1 Tax=Bdellovibrio sp. HCB337 TaxID=3394358 RepID=UPI0039A63BC5